MLSVVILMSVASSISSFTSISSNTQFAAGNLIKCVESGVNQRGDSC